MGLPVERVVTSDGEIMRAEAGKIIDEFREALKENPAFNSVLIEQYWKKPYIDTLRFTFKDSNYEFSYDTDGYGQHPSIRVSKYMPKEDSPCESVSMLVRGDDCAIRYEKRAKGVVTCAQDNQHAVDGARGMLEGLKTFRSLFPKGYFDNP